MHSRGKGYAIGLVSQRIDESVTPQLRGVFVIPDLIGNPEKSMLDSRFRGNDSIEVRSLPTRLRHYKFPNYTK